MEKVNRVLFVLIIAILVVGTIIIYKNYSGDGVPSDKTEETTDNTTDISKETTENTTDNSKETTENLEEDTMAGFTSISMDEAKEIFATKGDYIILDVRRSDEFASGHIPGAINVANEDISKEKIETLPDMDQTIYVYCRTGRRSKQAATKLSSIGYTNIIECGGIVDWPGDLEY